MTEITVLPLDPGAVAVRVREGEDSTEHRVAVPEGFLDQLAIADADPQEVARETVAFLLDRIPGDAIPGEVSVYDVARDHEGFTDELLARLGR